MLDDWLDEVVQYQTHQSQDVRKWVVGFIEEACKKDPEILTRVVANLRLMIADSVRVSYVLSKLKFQRGTVGLCRSTGVKVTSCQSWRFEKNLAA